MPYLQEGCNIIVGRILAGIVIGVISALIALALGQTIWMALLIYSFTGVLGVLTCAAITALTARHAPKPDPALRSPPPED